MFPKNKPRKKFLMYFTFVVLSFGFCVHSAAGVAHELIDIIPSNNGVGVYEILDQDKAVDVAEKISIHKIDDDIYQALDDENGEIVFLPVDDGLFLAMDNIMVTGNNVEDVIATYHLKQVIADDLKSVHRTAGQIQAILPHKIENDGNSIFSYYNFEGYQLQMVQYLVKPLKNPSPKTLFMEQNDEKRGFISRLIRALIDAIRSAIVENNLIKFHDSDIDRIEITLEEFKTRSYVRVFEGDDYILRLKHDAAVWRFLYNEIANDKAHATHSYYLEDGKDMNATEMNQIACKLYGEEREKYFNDTISAYESDRYKKVMFESQLGK